MKRPFNWIAVLCLTSLFGITFTFLWFKYNPPMLSYEESLAKGIPSVEYCDLRNNPYKFNGKVVRLTTDLQWFMHGYFIYDASCNDRFEGDGLDESRTAILPYKENWAEIYEYLRKFHEAGKSWEPLQITAVGRFQYKHAKGFSDGIEDRTSFRFEIYKIESASR